MWNIEFSSKIFKITVRYIPPKAHTLLKKSTKSCMLNDGKGIFINIDILITKVYVNINGFIYTLVKKIR